MAEATINAKADELFRRFAKDHDEAGTAIPARATLRALALVELCELGSGRDLGSSTAPRALVTLIVNAQDPTQAVGAGGVALADGSTRTLLCDPDLHPVVVDSLGVPLDMGHTIRFANAAQRRAVAIRDGGCVFPGCDQPIGWCDVHHLDPWAQRGRTDVDRLAGLCRHHHGVSHRKGWTMHATADGWFWWQTPTGRTLWSQRHHRKRDHPPPPIGPDPPGP